VLTIKPHQTNTKCYRVIQLRSVSTRSIEGRDLYLTEIISHIGERVKSSTHVINWRFKCHGVCGDNNEVYLLVLHVTNTGKFRLNMKFWLSFIEQETNKLLRRSNMFPFFIWTQANTQSRQHFLNRAREDSRRYAVTVAFFVLKKENWRYLT